MPECRRRGCRSQASRRPMTQRATSSVTTPYAQTTASPSAGSSGMLSRALDGLLHRQARSHQRRLLERFGEVLGQESDRDDGGENSREDHRDRCRRVPCDRTDTEREQREQAEVHTTPDDRAERLAVGERHGRVAALVVEPVPAEEPLTDLEAGRARCQVRPPGPRRSPRSPWPRAPCVAADSPRRSCESSACCTRT